MKAVPASLRHATPITPERALLSDVQRTLSRGWEGRWLGGAGGAPLTQEVRGYNLLALCLSGFNQQGKTIEVQGESRGARSVCEL